MDDSVSKICLFVRNLPYSLTDAELETIFKPYGTIRSCYIVRDKGPDKKSRGFSYVTYVNREDASKAKSNVKVIQGRPVQVEFARRKLFNANKSKVGVDEKGQKGGALETEEGVAGESSDEGDDYEALTARKRLGLPRERKQRKPRSERGQAKFDIGRVVVIANIPAEGKEKTIHKKCEKFGEIDEIVFPANSDPQRAHVTFSTHKAARLASKELNNTRYKKKAEGVLKVSLLSQESKSVSSKTLKKSRIIVRNLSFQCEQDDVKQDFEKFGSVLRVDMPVKEDGKKRGYAFVQFGSYFDAAKAIAGMNDKKIKGRKVTVDWLLPKAEYKETQGSGGCGQEGEESEEECPGSEGEELESGQEATGNEDEAESMDMGGDEEVRYMGTSGSEEENSNEDEEEEEFQTGSEDEDDTGSEDEVETGSEDEEEETGSEDAGTVDAIKEKGRQNKKRFQDDTSEGKTLFIRDLPFSVDQLSLKKVFARFGLLRYCRVMRSPATGVATGSAFVQFTTPASALKCLHTAEQGDKGVWFDGQRLSVAMALPQREVEQSRWERQERQEKEDRRNLYLAKEGVIFPDSAAAKDVSKADMLKRTRAYAEKKAKLSKPHYYVSKTRLCVRNLPTSVDERKLKALFQQSKVVQVKLMRSSERVDVKGVGRSMGYGFVEFADHASALSALRSTNNNPDLFGKVKRPIVDFAVEDSRIMKIREKKLAKQLKATAGSEEGGAVGSAGNPRSMKRHRWQLKWQARRVKRKEQLLSGVGEGRTAHKRNSPKHQSNLATQERFKNGRSQKSGVGSSTIKRAPRTMRKSQKKEEQVDRRGGVKVWKQKRNRKAFTRRSAHGNEEERQFSKMVAKYREKLNRIN